jgi:hypothetical protein
MRLLIGLVGLSAPLLSNGEQRRMSTAALAQCKFGIRVLKDGQFAELLGCFQRFWAGRIVLCVQQNLIEKPVPKGEDFWNMAAVVLIRQ